MLMVNHLIGFGAGGEPTAQGVLISPNNMTADGTFGVTAPSARGSSVSPTQEAYKAFDGDITTFNGCYRHQNTTVNPTTLELYIGGGAQYCFSYSVRGRPDTASDWPTAWTLSISTDGVSYSQIDTQSGISWTSAGQEKSFICATPLAGYGVYFKFTITAATSQDFVISEIKLYN